RRRSKGGRTPALRAATNLGDDVPHRASRADQSLGRLPSRGRGRARAPEEALRRAPRRAPPRRTRVRRPPSGSRPRSLTRRARSRLNSVPRRRPPPSQTPLTWGIDPYSFGAQVRGGPHSFGSR